jgi:hypothetical protein
MRELADRVAGEVLAPIIHLNGTSYDSLRKEYKEAGAALRNAINAMNQLTVHGRDYAPDIYPQARAEHVERIRQLEKIYKELASIAMQISRQGK